MHIVVVVGTNRDGAISRRLAEVLKTEYSTLGHSVDLLDLADMGPNSSSVTATKNQPPRHRFGRSLSRRRRRTFRCSRIQRLFPGRGQTVY